MPICRVDGLHTSDRHWGLEHILQAAQPLAHRGCNAFQLELRAAPGGDAPTLKLGQLRQGAEYLRVNLDQP